MPARHGGKYYVDAIVKDGRQLLAIRVTTGASRRTAAADAADILTTGLTVGSHRYDVRGVIVDQVGGFFRTRPAKKEM
jgi:hypothetical protein